MSFYFICEGAEGKAEYTFISKIIESFHSDECYKLISASGKDNIENCFLNLSLDFKSGDTFILFFDNIESINGKPTINLLDNIYNVCKENNVAFRYTTYYCFKELFLTYLNIRDLLKDSELKDEFIKVQDKILSEVNYYNSDISYWRDYFTPHNVGALKTREKLSFAICSEVFKRLPTGFGLSKSIIGTCWIDDCSSAYLNKNACNRCKYCLGGQTFIKKLEDLDKNSISRLSLPFSTIFDDYMN